MKLMSLELRCDADSDVDAIDVAKGWAATGEAIAHAAGCESIRAKMQTAKSGTVYSVLVTLTANVPSNSVAGNIAKEWKDISDIDAEVTVYTGSDVVYTE